MQDTYEVWTEKVDGSWTRIIEGKNDGIFENNKRALAVAGKASQDEDVLRVVVIKRIPVAEFNGAAKTLPRPAPKKRFVLVENSPKKKEAAHGRRDVHGDRPQEDQDRKAGPQLAGGSGPPGAESETAPH